MIDIEEQLKEQYKLVLAEEAAKRGEPGAQAKYEALLIERGELSENEPRCD